MRGSFLRSLLVSPPQVLSVRLHGARIEGALDLSWLTLDWPLALVDCAFAEPIVAASTSVAGLDLSGSHLPGLDAAGLRTRGRVVLDRVVATGPVLLQECRLGGSLWCRDAEVQGVAAGSQAGEKAALDLDLARVDGEVDLTRTVSAGSVQVPCATIGRQLICKAGSLSNPGGHALAADAADITGGVFLTGGFTATGAVHLLGTTIGGQLNCEGGSFVNPDGHALAADQAHIAGGVFLTGGFTATGEVRLLGATIGGVLACGGGSLTNPDGHALKADGADITGDVFLTGGFTATGEVRLLGATVGGQLNCRGGSFANPDGYALAADGADITGSVFLTGGFTATGEVRLLGATIAGQLNCRNGTLERPGGYALNGEGVKIAGHVLLDAGFKATGEVSLWGATINGGANFGSARLDNREATALSLDNAAVVGVVLLDAGFEAHGAVSLIGARLDRGMDVTGSFDAGDRRYALDLERAHVATALRLAPRRCTGIVDLTDATVGTLRDRKDRWPDKLRLEGFSYRHLEAEGSTPRDRLGWLGRNADARGETTFSPRPYEQLAAVYRAAGNARAARTVGIAAQREFRRRQLTERRDLPRRAWSAFLDATVAYGYRPGQALLWLAGLWAASVGMVLAASAAGRLRELAGEGTPTPDFQPLVYAADVLVPIIDLNQAAYWQPTWPYDLWYWTAIVGGWALATALAAGVAAALRRS